MASDYLPLLSLGLFIATLLPPALWAVNGANKAYEERIRQSEEDLIREVWGPEGKPKKPTAEPESRSRSAG
jgi:hypothetical protein